jgi:hypothetical protein
MMTYLRRSAKRIAPHGFNPGNAGDVDPDQEIFRHLQRKRWLLAPEDSPYSLQRRRWRKFLMLLVFYQQFAVPFQLSFETPETDGSFLLPVAQCVLVYLIDLCFWVDIGLMFRSTYMQSHEEGGELVTDARDIARRYRAKGFWFDLAASLPLEWFACMAGYPIQCLFVHKMRVNRLLRITRVVTLHSEVFALARVRRLCVFGFFFFILSHYIACMWWALGNAPSNMDEFATMGYLPWMERVPNRGAACPSPAHLKCPEPARPARPARRPRPRPRPRPRRPRPRRRRARRAVAAAADLHLPLAAKQACPSRASTSAPRTSRASTGRSQCCSRCRGFHRSPSARRCSRFSCS